MRKQDSEFNQMCETFNDFTAQDKPFTPQDFREAMGINQTSQYEPIAWFLSKMVKLGFASRVERGVYQVEYVIPDEFTYTDMDGALGNKTFFVYKDGNWERTERKKNFFDVKAYFNHIDGELEDEIPMPHSSGNVVQTEAKPSPETKTIYVVDMKTAAVTPTTVMRFDTSYLMMPNAFEDEDSADAFAEGIVVPECEEDVELENALEEIDNDIAETLFRESDPASDPEYKYSGPTEEQFEAAKAEMVNFDLSEDCEAEAPAPMTTNTQVLGSYVALILSVGTKVWSIELNGDTVIATADEVESIFITVNATGIEYEFETRQGDTFTKRDLGVKVFTDKKEAVEAVAALLELV